MYTILHDEYKIQGILKELVIAPLDKNLHCAVVCCRARLRFDLRKTFVDNITHYKEITTYGDRDTWNKTFHDTDLD